MPSIECSCGGLTLPCPIPGSGGGEMTCRCGVKYTATIDVVLLHRRVQELMREVKSLNSWRHDVELLQDPSIDDRIG